MKKIFFLFLITIFLSGCSKSGKLTIEGTITDAEGKSLVLEMLSSTTKPDTVKLNQKGNFKFTLPAAKAPEYFLLKLDNQSISLAADSNEVIKIKSSFNNFSNDYTVEGSVESEKIKEIVSKGITLKLKMIELENQLSGKKISMTEYADSVRVAVAVYKEFVLPFIFENPSSAAAYFSIFQKVNGLMIFDSNDKSDYQAFAAVATAWDVYHKESPRTKQLVDFTLNAYRKRKSVENLSKNLENIQEQNYIEIVLPDMKGHDVRLSDQEGNVVLLNFTAYEAEYSGPYNMQLAKIFDKYKNKGFTIYQVSLDSDDNFRKITSSNLPWITVHDKESVYSRFARSYNVTSLPTSYLLDKDGSIVLRVNNLDDLDKEIAKLL